MQSRGLKFHSGMAGSRYFKKKWHLVSFSLFFFLSLFYYVLVLFSERLSLLVVPNSSKLHHFAAINLSRKTLPEMSLIGERWVMRPLLILTTALETTKHPDWPNLGHRPPWNRETIGPIRSIYIEWSKCFLIEDWVDTRTRGNGCWEGKNNRGPLLQSKLVSHYPLAWTFFEP